MSWLTRWRWPVWEVWRETDGENETFSMGPSVSIKDEQRRGLIGPDAVRIHRFRAPTYEKAMRHYHELMGWEPWMP